MQVIDIKSFISLGIKQYQLKTNINWFDLTWKVHLIYCAAYPRERYKFGGEESGLEEMSEGNNISSV